MEVGNKSQKLYTESLSWLHISARKRRFDCKLVGIFPLQQNRPNRSHLRNINWHELLWQNELERRGRVLVARKLIYRYLSVKLWVIKCIFHLWVCWGLLHKPIYFNLIKTSTYLLASIILYLNLWSEEIFTCVWKLGFRNICCRIHNFYRMVGWVNCIFN